MEQNLVDEFTKQVIRNNLEYDDLDYHYVFNKIVALIGTNEVYGQVTDDNLLLIVDKLIDSAVNNHIIDNNRSMRMCLNAQLMDLITPLPHQVNQIFWEKYKKNPRSATNYFYQLCCNNNYIQTRDLAKNKEFTVDTNWGNLEITINLSKPEKDPKAIANAAKQIDNNNYPLCKLCDTNEGYVGRLNYPARSNLRIINLTINGQQWGFQYSPYGYFKEHAIFLTKEHVPMKINSQTYSDLLMIVKQFPFYFVGSNADLPIVGGSVLSHKHYQGGCHIFPMMKADTWHNVSTSYKDVDIKLVNWPLSTIRLQSKNIESLVTVATSIQYSWQHYSDPSVHVYAQINGQLHHTITPVAYYRDNHYVLDMVLRDNHTSQQYPDGEFHVHPQYHHIKKENIGLIEVMGRAILPGRLQDELLTVAQFLNGKKVNVSEKHRTWAKQLKQQYGIVPMSIAEDIIRQELGDVFAKILENTGVFKQNIQGKNAFLKFIDYWQNNDSCVSH